MIGVASTQLKRISANNLPDFIVIGAMKTGTTSLQHYLECHPLISMAPKELNFFNESINWHRGLDWYRRHFQQDDLIQGEVSPNYSKCHLYRNIPEKIHAVVPRVKIIYVLREPVARIISHFSHTIGDDTENRSHKQILNDSFDNFVNTSRYMAQLEQYLQFFEMKQILIITAEKLRDKRQETLKQIFRFLDVDDSFSSDSFNQIRHDSSVKVKRNLLGRTFVRYPLLRYVESGIKSIVPRQWYPLFAQVIGKNFSQPVLSPRQKAEIKELLRDDVQRLKKLTGSKFEEWQWPD